MAEFVIRLADERGHVQEQIQSAATAEELRTRFSQAGYFVYSVKPRGLTGTARKTKLETFLIFNQQFLTLIRAGMPILGSLEMLAKSQKNAVFSGQLQNVAARVRTGEPISNAFEAQGAFPQCIRRRCWPESAPAIWKRFWGGICRSSGSRWPSARNWSRR